jgi:predicted PurR-regulated permease PerM
MVFVRFLVFIVIAVVIGIVFNKFVIKHFSDNKRKLFCVLTMLIFILSAISLAITFSIKSGIVSSISTYSDRVEKYIYDNNPNNAFLINGINLNIINDNSSIINDSVNQLRSLVPTYTDLRINKRIYDMVIGEPMDELINQINNLTGSVTDRANNMVSSVSMLADSNNFITVSSIFNYLKSLANRHINIVFLRIIIVLLVPFLVYVISTSVYVIISARKR